MKSILWFVVLILITHAGQSKTFRMIGKLKESTCKEHFCSYTFVNVRGESKTFMQSHHWRSLPYDLAKRYYQNKSFEVVYHSIYDRLSDSTPKQWIRRIDLIRLIPETRQYLFVGKFAAASVLEGSGHYTFVGLNGSKKEFAHDAEWPDQDLPYDLLDQTQNASDSYIDKWFKITYHGVYGVLSGDDGAVESWHRKIKTIKMIPIPRSEDIVIADTATLVNFRILDGIAEFDFGDGRGNYTQLKCNSSELRQFDFDFSDEEIFLETFHNQKFKLTFRMEYILESNIPVTKKLLSLEIL